MIILKRICRDTGVICIVIARGKHDRFKNSFKSKKKSLGTNWTFAIINLSPYFVLWVIEEMKLNSNNSNILQLMCQNNS